MVDGDGVLATQWGYRPSGFFVVSIAAALVVVANYGVRGVPGALLLVAGALTWSLRGITQLSVYSDKLVMRLGPFGVVRRELSREDALLWTHRWLSFDALTVKRLGGHLIGPFVSASLEDRWPEAELRAAGFKFQN